MEEKKSKKLSLSQKLSQYKNQKIIPMHMPGHKQNEKYNFLTQLFDVKSDITEIYGFDNLHYANDILKQSMDKASSFFCVEKSFYLVNGSTCGIFAALKTLTNFNDKVLVARNCHKAVFNAIELFRLDAEFTYPHFDKNLGVYGSLDCQDIKQKLSASKDIKVLILTSPTYEGVLSDIKSICEIAHKYNVKVIVDEAHGAHLGFSGFEQSARQLGADLVVESLHKTLPCPTQSAILHVCSKDIDCLKIERNLEFFETSSPSYLFLSAIDGMIDFVKNSQEFEKWNKNIDFFEKNTKNLKNLVIMRNSVIDNNKFFKYDKSKIVVFSNSKSNGVEIANKLRNDFSIECEMISSNYIICMTGMGDEIENIQALTLALNKIDKELSFTENDIQYDMPACKKFVSSWQVNKGELNNLDECIGKISCEYVWLYPPGSPIIVAGEIISKEIVEFIKKMQILKLNINSTFSKLEYGLYVEDMEAYEKNN